MIVVSKLYDGFQAPSSVIGQSIQIASCKSNKILLFLTNTQIRTYSPHLRRYVEYSLSSFITEMKQCQNQNDFTRYSFFLSTSMKPQLCIAVHKQQRSSMKYLFISSISCSWLFHFDLWSFIFLSMPKLAQQQ